MFSDSKVTPVPPMPGRAQKVASWWKSTEPSSAAVRTRLSACGVEAATSGEVHAVGVVAQVGAGEVQGLVRGAAGRESGAGAPGGVGRERAAGVAVEAYAATGVAQVATGEVHRLEGVAAGVGEPGVGAERGVLAGAVGGGRGQHVGPGRGVGVAEVAVGVTGVVTRKERTCPRLRPGAALRLREAAMRSPWAARSRAVSTFWTLRS